MLSTKAIAFANEGCFVLGPDAASGQMHTSMNKLIAEFSLTEIGLSSPLEEGLAPHSGCGLAQSQTWISAANQLLTKFASEECFDRILYHLTSTFEAFHDPSPRPYTRKKLDSTALFAICRMLHHAKLRSANTRSNAPLGSPARTEHADSETNLDPKILPLVLRCIRPWRLEDPWARYDGIIGEGDVAKLDAVELATALAALANNSRTDLEEAPIYSGSVRLRIKWLGRVDSEDPAVGSLYKDHTLPSPNIEPEVKDGESDVQPPRLEASLFRSGCLACRLPRQALCPGTCSRAQQRNKSTTNMRLVKAEAESKGSRPTPHPIHPHPRNKDRVHGRSTTSEGATNQSKPIASVRPAPKRSKENNTKENISPAIKEPRLLPPHPDSSAYRDMAASSIRANTSQAQTTISSVSARPALFSDVNFHEQPQSNITSFSESGVVRSTTRTRTGLNSWASVLRSSSSSRSTSRPISRKEQRDAKPFMQLTRSRSLQRTTNSVPSGAHHLSTAVKDQNAAQSASSLDPAVSSRILGQRNR